MTHLKAVCIPPFSKHSYIFLRDSIPYLIAVELENHRAVLYMHSLLSAIYTIPYLLSPFDSIIAISSSVNPNSSYTSASMIDSSSFVSFFSSLHAIIRSTSSTNFLCSSSGISIIGTSFNGLAYNSNVSPFLFPQ